MSEHQTKKRQVRSYATRGASTRRPERSGRRRQPRSGRPPRRVGCRGGRAGRWSKQTWPRLRLSSRSAPSDVQRVHAEYANYRKRVDRDRELVRRPIHRSSARRDAVGARRHRPSKRAWRVVGGFKSVADSFEAVVTKLGLEKFGEAGDPFDPTVHEALTHTESTTGDPDDLHRRSSNPDTASPVASPPGPGRVADPPPDHSTRCASLVNHRTNDALSRG